MITADRCAMCYRDAMRPERDLPRLPHRRARRDGTTLILGSGRHVRVLTLPPVCGQRLLARRWDDCFGSDGADDVEVWWPLDPVDPSRN